jgi:NADH-quinone oxidoreductase subunit M
MYQNVMLGEVNDTTAGFTDLSGSELAVFVVVIVAIFYFGIHPKPLLHMAEEPLKNILTLSFK